MLIGNKRGNAIVEFALIAPLLAMLCLVVLDAGVYVTAFISVQSAARAAAAMNSGGTSSASDQENACTVAIEQLRGLPGVPAGTCGSAPLIVTSVYCGGAGPCGTAADTADGKPAALVTVTYTLPSLFRVPLTGPPAISISSQMKIRSTD